MKKKFTALILYTVIFTHFAIPVSARVLDYEATVKTYKQNNKIPKQFNVQDAYGNAVQVVAKEEIVYVASKNQVIRAIPGSKGRGIKRIFLGTELRRVAVCDNGWSKVVFAGENNERKIGYVPTQELSDLPQLEVVNETFTAVKDCDILDYPGRKDGQVIGEILELDEVRRTGIINGVWSRILFKDDNNKKKIGYIPTNVLKGQERNQEITRGETDEKTEAGIIHQSEGSGIFAEAVDGVTTDSQESTAGVCVGNPVAVSSDAVLKSLGTFKITHYCSCSICCGPWANGITSTGSVATTNRTIAVDPNQIPYGSKIVINGQIYVAEDCGGAIKEKCIDIYVATHEEGERKGVYYTEVYVIQE